MEINTLDLFGVFFLIYVSAMVYDLSIVDQEWIDISEEFNERIDNNMSFANVYNLATSICTNYTQTHHDGILIDRRVPTCRAGLLKGR